MSIQAMKQALEALQRYQVKRQDFDRFADEITALRAAIAEAEKCEPFGVWHQGDTEDESDFFLGDAVDGKCCDRCIPLYTHPQPAIPAGYALVPVDPTDRMLEAGLIGDARYARMLAAAPKPENSHE